MNTTQLECFLAVANHLNFSRAAEQLQITQPAVSHQIKTLEDELGVKLFIRTSKSVRLTQEGHLYVQYADDILKLAGLSKARLKECQTAQPMRLGIGCRNTAELHLVRTALARLHEEKPELLPVVRLIPFDSLGNLLQEGDIQLMFSFQEVAPRNGVYREFLQCPIVCICAEDHPLASHTQLTLEELKSAGRMAVCRPPICPPSLFSIQAQLVMTHGPGQVIFCETHEVVYTLAETGYAFAVMFDFPPIRIPGLRYIPMPEFAPLSFGTSHLPTARSPVLRRFLTLLDESFSSPAPGIDMA